ncbi:MAG: hypothetical protein EOP12_02885 [Pseudomonas sp.]|nr:MAG: hypothetical protein EOP12_02885 [Pseudomonas sp.]
MRKIMAVLLCTVAGTTSFALELGAYPKVFSGPEGTEVVLAPTADGKGALFRISGVSHAVDKVVFMSQLERWGGGTDAFVTTFDGRDSAMVQKKSSSYGGGDRYVAYLPGIKKELDLAYDEKKSKALKPSVLLATYETQKQQGVQEKLARFDRDKSVAYSRGQLDGFDKQASASCGVPIKTTIEWTAIDDDKLKKLSVHSFCGAVAMNMQRLCSDDGGAFKKKAAALGQISCQFGPELKARVLDQKLVFTTESNAPNQDDFIREFLRNQ